MADHTSNENDLKRRIQNLAESYRDDPQKIKEISDAMLSYSRYTQSVIMMEHKFGEQGTFRYIADSEDTYMQVLETADRHRRDCHNTIVSYTLMLNNAAKAKGLPPIHDGLIADRAAIGNLAFAIQKEFFENRQWTPYIHSLKKALTVNKSPAFDGNIPKITPNEDTTAIEP